ncbi:MAG TPA: YkgJ family cysteine cluster protein [Cyclobacteriaceae bacterium]|nr:YkgJ family cysteine cluster protein [Cyclobacteriaceae bacterium]
MDQLEEKVFAVENVFKKLDAEISKFQSWSTLSCDFGCGKCCFKSDIEATPLEFLPFALHLFKANQAEVWLQKLIGSKAGVCLILHPHQSGAGLCSEYAYRGLICRLFGYSARTNKYGKRELVTCQIIKTGQAEKFADAEKKIDAGMDVPVMSEYYMQLASVDFEMARTFYPINEAIRKAIQEVLHYYAYR